MDAVNRQLYPVFLRLDGRRVLLVGGGGVAAAKLPALLAAGARVTVVAPEVRPEIARADVIVERRAFDVRDLDGVSYVVAAATPEVNHFVAATAEERRLFVNAVDDKASASVFLGGVVRRDGVVVAISTEGEAPALAGLLREGVEALLPPDLSDWIAVARIIRKEWKEQAVPMAERRPRLLAALNALYEQRAIAPPAPLRRDGIGRVALVGAGPGDPELLTLKAAKRLEEADLVLYDALVSPVMLRLAPNARWFYVGKRAGRESMSQEAIQRLLVRAAKRGEHVVRLKGGDPFVFGRGGEEALALAEEGIACEVIPGVSSAVAAPALAGIPMTHRGLATAFTVVSGHAESAYTNVLSSLAPGSATVVVLMGLKHREQIAHLLRARGWDAATPAAIVLNASHPDTTAWIGTLAELGTAAVVDDHPEMAGVLVIGAVAALAEVIGPQMRDERLARIS